MIGETTGANALVNNPNCPLCKTRAEKEGVQLEAANRTRFICFKDSCQYF